jgi:hypothetical protein
MHQQSRLYEQSKPCFYLQVLAHFPFIWHPLQQLPELAVHEAPTPSQVPPPPPVGLGVVGGVGDGGLGLEVEKRQYPLRLTLIHSQLGAAMQSV